jgi:hypothetical protein
VLRSADEVEQGQRVYLWPQTKTASRACHDKRAVTVMHDPKRWWPYLVVEWKDDAGSACWERVHADNIRKSLVERTSAAEKKTGDAVGGGTTKEKWSRVRVMPGKSKEIQLAEGEEQGTLF